MNPNNTESQPNSIRSACYLPPIFSNDLLDVIVGLGAREGTASRCHWNVGTNLPDCTALRSRIP